MLVVERLTLTPQNSLLLQGNNKQSHNKSIHQTARSPAALTRQAWVGRW